MIATLARVALAVALAWILARCGALHVAQFALAASVVTACAVIFAIVRKVRREGGWRVRVI